MRETIMCTIRPGLIAFILLLIPTLGMVGCKKPLNQIATSQFDYQAKSNQETESANSSKEANPTNLVSEDSVPAILSGIWYHSIDDNVIHPAEMNFSWGKESFDQDTALCIDLLGNQKRIGVGSASWDSVSYSINTQHPNSINLHMEHKDYPGMADVVIQVIDRTKIVFNFQEVSTAETREIDGKYYKRISPIP